MTDIDRIRKTLSTAHPTALWPTEDVRTLLVRIDELEAERGDCESAKQRIILAIYEAVNKAIDHIEAHQPLDAPSKWMTSESPTKETTPWK